jgi:flagellar motor switch protein FliG
MANIVRRGIAAYQQTMKPPEERQTEPPDRENAGGLLKNVKGLPEARLRVPRPGSVLPQTGEPSPDSKCRRVAKFLILIGGDRAADIIAELDPGQVEEISREIASIRGITPEEGSAILAEFRSLFAMPAGFTGASSGGVETARRILYAAYGPERGEALLNKTVPGSKENAFGFLETFSPDQLVVLLKGEAPQAAALILARLPPKLSAETLGKMPPERKPEILKRIARQGEIAPEVLERVAAALREKARHFGASGAADLEINGMQTLAAILKQGDYSFGDRLISELETEAPAIGKDLKEKLYTLDDVIRAVDRPLREKLNAMSDRDIAVLLKGRESEFSEKILSNVSAARRALIREEGEILGAVPKRDCDAAAREFLTWFRLAREDGTIILSSDEDVFV